MTRWDNYFLNLCTTISSHSRCLSRKIGVVIVRDKSILSTGYNGPARGVQPCSERSDIIEFIDPTLREQLSICPRRLLGFPSGAGLNYCPAAHAESNAIANAARTGTNLLNSTLYANCEIPCKSCLSEIINAGISEIVITKLHTYDSLTPWILKNQTLKIRDFDGNSLTFSQSPMINP